MGGFNHKNALQRVTHHPGVYLMLDERGMPLYVGKAKDLRKRVGSYFGRTPESPKTRALLKQVDNIKVTVTRTEAEALLLESNLIKRHRPRYNVLLRDDKSYPYLYLSTKDKYPRLMFYRGAQSGKGRYFGPFPSARSARHALNLTQKLFRLRPCEDSFFNNRSRPCLQYQIERCTAPCVGLVDEPSYREDVNHASLFLEGKNEAVLRKLNAPMQQAADALDYERAARYRDQIVTIRKIQENQCVTASRGELDILACHAQDGAACVQVFFVRGGLNLGNKAFFPEHTGELDAAQVLNAFMAQYYLGNRRGETRIPQTILTSHSVADARTLMELLSEREGRAVRIHCRPRKERKKWLEMAVNNAEIALKTRLSSKETRLTRLLRLQAVLELSDPIARIECFDVSHVSGEATVASCVVFDGDGPIKTAYRRFNIKGVPAGDDYAAMAQAFERRYRRVRKCGGTLPDLILIDGGKGQVRSIRQQVEELQLDEITILGVAKGPARKPGMERLIFDDGRRTLTLPPDSSALHLIQEVRDEAHRFAISGHRRQRNRKRTESALEQIEGIGAQRRRALIRFFGGIQGVTNAGVEELARVEGISNALARKIYARFHANQL